MALDSEHETIASKGWRERLDTFRKDKEIPPEDWQKFLNERYRPEGSKEDFQEAELVKGPYDAKPKNPELEDQRFADSVIGEYKLWKSDFYKPTEEPEAPQRRERKLNPDDIIREGLEMQRRSDEHAAEERKKKEVVANPPAPVVTKTEVQKPKKEAEKANGIRLTYDEKGMVRFTEGSGDYGEQIKSAFGKLVEVWGKPGAIVKVSLGRNGTRLTEFTFTLADGSDIKMEAFLFKKAFPGQAKTLTEKEIKPGNPPGGREAGIKFENGYIYGGTNPETVKKILKRISVNGADFDSSPEVYFYQHELGKK